MTDWLPKAWTAFKIVLAVGALITAPIYIRIGSVDDRVGRVDDRIGRVDARSEARDTKLQADVSQIRTDVSRILRAVEKDQITAERSNPPVAHPVADLVAMQLAGLPDDHLLAPDGWRQSFMPAFLMDGTLPDDDSKLRYCAGYEGYTIGRIQRRESSEIADEMLKQALIRFPARHHDAIRIGIAAGRSDHTGTYPAPQHTAGD